MNTRIVATVAALFALAPVASAQAGGYRLTSVDQVEIQSESVRITTTLPCDNIDALSFVVAAGDSGSLEADVGVVYACSEGPMKTFTSVVTPSWPEYAAFQQVIRTGGSFATMHVRQ